MQIISTSLALLVLGDIVGAFGSAAKRGEHENLPWEAATQKANEFISQLNITEKARIVTGSLNFGGRGCIGNILPIERLNFSGICLQDGPTAMNRADLVSVFPSGITVAASWDRELIYQRGRALGEEFRGKGAHVILGPVAGPLGRHPLGGRNWEGFSPDPYLTGVAMEETIKGIQSMGIQACAKHYIGNEQEVQRSNTFVNGTEIAAISSNIDDRTLHELYLWPFANSVKANVSSFMCSYNRLNQTYACENDNILNQVLKKELGFQGYVMSDWFATHSGPKSINAGLDLDMPGVIDAASLITGDSYFGGNITKYLDEGSVAEERLDDMIRRIMTQYYLLKQDNSNFPETDPTLLMTLAASVGQFFGIPEIPGGLVARDVRGDHAQLIRQMAAEATVLLKNTNETLPLKSPQSIAVFGNDANDPINGLYQGSNEDYEFGVVDIGGGSGTARHTYLVSPLQAIRARAERQNGTRFQHITNNALLARGDFSSLFPVPEVCLVFLGTWASEGQDRTELEADWNSTLVVENVAGRCPNTIVVTHSAGINSMPWADNPNVTAILAAHLPGQEAGNSVVDVLWGDVNPSGRLPYTIGKESKDFGPPIVNLTEAEVTSPTAWQANFVEGQLIDYRHFDSAGIDPLYDFGFGLSYTTFEVEGELGVESVSGGGNLTARTTPMNTAVPGGNPELWETILLAKTQVKNTGKRAGSAVPQLYVSFPGSEVPSGTPLQVLRGFDKVDLEPGESKVVSFNLQRRDLSYWNVDLQDWVLPAGAFEFKVGFSSRNTAVSASKALR
ncbi:glycoside hydrolase family 3 protein [Aaosphaeria arxii CBS 175.79]|uniref:Probable beta-glucosidase G n=1 Tax=Aaosphaeria arxii CBS 175.79 TaxID=1450172 RepID=A0A6A5XE50_9PLEO|nr:glycoside hydrolase family 3 protein [Aaosphaeria arxii CBS 175.79]KAF2011308.1 glycoside hydrolase family 3 protein [Aaosphaeria arxii CBS 175.79]